MAQCANFIVGISTHTPLAGRDWNPIPVKGYFESFLLTRPSRDVTCSGGVLTHGCKFLLTRPSRDVTRGKRKPVRQNLFLLTRPSRDVTNTLTAAPLITKISTHTPLAGRDCAVRWKPSVNVISTHTPLAGRDPSGNCVWGAYLEFLLTRPSRDVT